MGLDGEVEVRAWLCEKRLAELLGWPFLRNKVARWVGEWGMSSSP